MAQGHSITAALEDGPGTTPYVRRVESSPPRCLFAFKNASVASPRGINGRDASGPGISDVIGDDVRMPMHKDNSMEIMENKEPRKERPGAPERAWHPGVKVVIIPGRGIIGHHGRTLGIVVIFDHRGLSVLRRCWRRTFSVSLWEFSDDWQLKFHHSCPECL